MTELIMGGLITRARARRRATRRLRESAYAYSRYLLVSHPTSSSLATYCMLCNGSTDHSLRPYDTFERGADGTSTVDAWHASAIYLCPPLVLFFCVLFILPLRPVAGKRALQAKECSTIARVEEHGSGKAGACASGGGVAPCPRGGSTSRDRARAATCAEESIRR